MGSPRLESFRRSYRTVVLQIPHQYLGPSRANSKVGQPRSTELDFDSSLGLRLLALDYPNPRGGALDGIRSRKRTWQSIGVDLDLYALTFALVVPSALLRPFRP